MRMTYEAGTRVLAPDNDGVVLPGVIVDNLTVMCYIELDDGRNVFVFKADKQLREIANV